MIRFQTMVVSTLLILTMVGCNEQSTLTGNENGNSDFEFDSDFDFEFDFDLDSRSPSKKIEGKGDIVAQTVDLPSFSKISSNIPANINVTVGSPQQIVVKAQQNVLDAMVLTVEDAEFRLNFEADITGIASKGIEVDVTIAEISHITSTSVGHILLSGPKQNEMSINISGVVTVEAYDLEVDRCSIDMAAVGHCKVRVTDTLNVALRGSGLVFYRGHPSIDVPISKIGNVINDN